MRWRVATLLLTVALVIAATFAIWGGCRRVLAGL